MTPPQKALGVLLSVLAALVLGVLARLPSLDPTAPTPATLTSALTHRELPVLAEPPPP